MRQAGAGVLFTQLSGAISGLKDKPNELLCVRVQMRDTILPPSPPSLPCFPLPSKGTVWVIRPLNYAQGQSTDLHLRCVCMCACVSVCVCLLREAGEGQREKDA